LNHQLCAKERVLEHWQLALPRQLLMMRLLLLLQKKMRHLQPRFYSLQLRCQHQVHCQQHPATHRHLDAAAWPLGL
jgi:hypothetical protein